jgi:hypothetical protein
MKKPFWHALQEEDEAFGEKYPAGQTLHADDSVVCPGFGENFPATHAEQLPSRVNPSPSEYLPAEQL